jgi:preprotein translocase subunit SecG
MTTVLLLIHLFVTIALIGVVLIQRSEGGGLGIGNSQGMGAFMSGRGTANLLTRTTAILAAIFFGLSLALALINKGTGGVGRSLLDVAPASAPAPAGALPPLAPAQAPGTELPTAPAGTAPATSAPAEPAPPPPAPTQPNQPPAPGVPTN